MKRVAILGGTGMMGQKFAQLLSKHPWFEVSAIAASDRRTGRTYAESVGSRSTHVPEKLAGLEVVEPKPQTLDDPDIVFSALPANAAGQTEEEFARAGMPVFSNASSHRMDPTTPLLNPEVNSEHSALVEEQKRKMKWDGFIVANPNCTTAILTLSLKPLLDSFGLESVLVSSMQSVSGAGYNGVASFDILQNVIPFIPGEEEKVESETNKILGTVDSPSRISVSASCHRVPTLNGHLEAVFVKTHSRATPKQAEEVLSKFESKPQRLKLPSAPERPIVVRTEEDRPQTRLDVDEGGGMSVSVGRVRPDPVLGGLKYIALGDNLVRGGAGCSILNAELFVSEKIIR